ncbi:MAG TPA: acyl carrier protein [Prolixibacteraceae bacterium]|jgi:acyl carrier protein|nr:acyl carrier protein [Prolixibacteraceae bacterium]
MTRQEIFSKITTIAKKIFGEKTIITEETASTDIEQWDSMNHVILISTIEKELNVSFDIMEVIGITKMGDFIDLIEKKQH